MRHEIRWLLGPCLLAAMLIHAPLAGALHDEQEQTRQQTLRRHHLGIQLGGYDPGAEIIQAGGSSLGIDGIAGLGILSYRYSLTPFVDLDLELRHWIGRWPRSSSDKVKIAGGFIGPGIRVYASDRTTGKRVIPYLQGNIYYVQEQLSTLATLYEHGVGFGVSGGMELNLSRLISLPIEATYVRSSGNNLDDLSGFGVSVGVNINF